MSRTETQEATSATTSVINTLGDHGLSVGLVTCLRHSLDQRNNVFGTYNVYDDTRVRSFTFQDVPLSDREVTIIANGSAKDQQYSLTSRSSRAVALSIAAGMDNRSALSLELMGGPSYGPQIGSDGYDESRHIVPGDANSDTYKMKNGQRAPTYMAAAQKLISKDMKNRLGQHVKYGNTYTNTSLVPDTQDLSNSSPLPATFGATVSINGMVVSAKEFKAGPPMPKGSEYLNVDSDEPMISDEPINISYKGWNGMVHSLTALLQNRHIQEGIGRLSVSAVGRELNKALTQKTFTRIINAIKQTPGAELNGAVSISSADGDMTRGVLSLRVTGSSIVLTIPAVLNGITYELVDGIITAYDTDSTSAMFWAGASISRSAKEIRQASLKNVFIQGAAGESRDIIATRIMSHDQWSGMPFAVKSLANDSTGEPLPITVIGDINSRNDIDLAPTVLPEHHIMYYGGIEFNHVRDLYTISRDSVERIEGYLYRELARMLSVQQRNPGLMNAHDRIKDLFTKNFKESCIYTLHSLIIGSGLEGMGAQEYQSIQAARIYLNITRVRTKHNTQQLITVLPNRFLVAQNIPLCLTSYGILAWEANPRIVSFFKEKTEIDRMVGTHDILKRFVAEYRSHSDSRASAISRTVLAVSSVKPFLVNKSDEVTHRLQLPSGISICLEPLIVDLFSKIKINTPAIVYTSNFAIFMFRGATDSESLVLVTTSTRISRYIPRSKNIAHNEMRTPSGFLPFGTVVYGAPGYIKGLRDYMMKFFT